MTKRSVGRLVDTINTLPTPYPVQVFQMRNGNYYTLSLDEGLSFLCREDEDYRLVLAEAWF